MAKEGTLKRKKKKRKRRRTEKRAKSHLHLAVSLHFRQLDHSMMMREKGEKVPSEVQGDETSL